MLKISDYISMMLSFFAIMIFYLIFSGSLSTNLGIYNTLDPIELPENYSVEEEYRSEEPVFAVICGNQETSEKTQNMVRMISNLKKEYAVFSTVDQISEQQAAKITTIVITAANWEEVGNKDLLIQYAEKQGKTLIFTDIMSEDTGEYNKIIGILKQEAPKKIDGLMIFEGLFIQGMVYYDNLELEVSDIRIDARCKKLAVEKTQEEKEQRELIPLIWEKRYGNGCFYVVNGDFLSGESGMGIFTGILSLKEDTYVYPVINAKASLLDSFPELDNPYENKIKELYSRDTNMFIRDIVWPSIVKLGESNTLIFSTRLNHPVGEKYQWNYEYLAEQIRKRSYEIDDSFSDKKWEIPYISSGHKRNENEIFKMQSSVSGQGLATHNLDMSEIMGKNAADMEYEWSSYSLELSKMMYDLYKNTDWMDAMTVSQARERYKRYLFIHPVIEKNENEIKIKTENFHDVCYYMIRTEKTVLPDDDYEVTKTGDGAYLIEVKKDDITVRLRENTEKTQNEV